MLKILERLEQELLTIPAVDRVRPISKIKELEGFSKYAIAYELAGDNNYKGRKGKAETPIFINCYANVDNGDMAVLWLRKQVKQLLDEADLSDANVKTYGVRYQSGTPQPEKNALLQAWQSVALVEIRWSEQ